MPSTVPVVDVPQEGWVPLEAEDLRSILLRYLAERRAMGETVSMPPAARAYRVKSGPAMLTVVQVPGACPLLLIDGFSVALVRCPIHEASHEALIWATQGEAPAYDAHYRLLASVPEGGWNEALQAELDTVAATLGGRPLVPGTRCFIAPTTETYAEPMEFYLMLVPGTEPYGMLVSDSFDLELPMETARVMAAHATGEKGRFLH